jgi:hypothetical protein
MTRVKTVRLPSENTYTEANKFGVEAEKLVLTLEGKYGAWSLIMPGAPKEEIDHGKISNTQAEAVEVLSAAWRSSERYRGLR